MGMAEERGKGFFWWELAWLLEGPGGIEWASQGLFDYNGNALPALGIPYGIGWPTGLRPRFR